MIAYLKGEITYKTPAYVYLDIGGIAYHVNISLNTYGKIEALEKVKLYTHLNVKEDSHTLYGFYDEEEKELFVLLISVSGIGPNTARIVLSSLEPSQVRYSILQEDVATFNKVKGIGPKTAKRIILDLKDKVAKNLSDEGISLPSNNNTIRLEALSALIALGFQRSSAGKVLDKVMNNNPEVKQIEDLIKLVLKQLS
jgi:Holliday junction DNA helicase RuvA